MNAGHFRLIFVWLWISCLAGVSNADPASALRLVPFPKQIEMLEGRFDLQSELVINAPRDMADQLGALIREELGRHGLQRCEVRRSDNVNPTLIISIPSGPQPPETSIPAKATSEGYTLEVRPSGIVCTAPDAAGLFFGVQTLCQLIRANQVDRSLPCLKVRDWPSLQWRCFQDDLTRGPSSTLPTLKQQIDLGAALKMNLFTYYMEYQYAFQKHPEIGPENGSLTPDELSALVEHARPRQIEILGNQQSFGHMTQVLRHEKYAALRETDYLLTPVREETYQLLDDLYSEVCPRLPFEMFNVCCDETWGLGTGPSKELAEQIGVGGVYVRHIRRVHDLLKNNYDKRMMMWGDIILQHPDQLDQIPKDTIMLTWGYSADASFEPQIIPFVKSGYEFFVCPGISNWSRILPDFGVATTNIQHFVRDGAKHGALGMLNTAWEDDGEALQGYKWHGYAWGAECAWNASSTTSEDFNRRIGAVLFGESGDHFGQAIALLSQAHRVPGMKGMMNGRFWENDFQISPDAERNTEAAEQLLAIVQPAIEHLIACRNDATVNADLLDAFLLGARRMERIGLRILDAEQAARAYAQAQQATDPAQRQQLLNQALQLVDANRQAHAELGREFERIWLSESKPYALDWTLDRYKALDQTYADLAARLKKE